MRTFSEVVLIAIGGVGAFQSFELLESSRLGTNVGAAAMITVWAFGSLAIYAARQPKLFKAQKKGCVIAIIFFCFGGLICLLSINGWLVGAFIMVVTWLLRAAVCYAEYDSEKPKD